MKYHANPVEVEAHVIVGVGQPFQDHQPDTDTGGRHLALQNGENVTATPEMLSRMSPVPGDYWVIQPDGYVYLNPKDVFERKYSAIPGAAGGM